MSAHKRECISKDIIPGSITLITHKVPTGTGNWGNSWTLGMTECVRSITKVRAIGSHQGLRVKGGMCSGYGWPCYCMVNLPTIPIE